MAKDMTWEELEKARESLSQDLREHIGIAEGNDGDLIGVDSSSNTSTLIEAARCKIPPYISWNNYSKYCSEYSDFYSYFAPESDSRVVSLQEVCDSLDYEVIEAFLENGITVGIDSHAAQERHREDILKLYERHGFARDVKSVWRAGDRLLPGGYGGSKRIPEGVIAIEGGAL